MQARSGLKVSKGHLTAKGRADLPEGDFALAGRRYPIENPGHARAALARAAANASPSEREEIAEKVHSKFPDMAVKSVHSEGEKNDERKSKLAAFHAHKNAR